MGLYAMKQTLLRDQISIIQVPTAQTGTLGEALSGLTLMVVSEEEAERRRQIEKGRRLAARENRKLIEAQARARITSEKVAPAPAVISAKPVVKTETPKVRVLYTPTPEEVEKLRADINRREASLLKAGRRADASLDKARLLAWAEMTRPSISVFIKALLESCFEYSRDDRNAAVYTCEDVEIRAFGAAMDQGRNGPRFDKRLNTEQVKARARLTQKSMSTPKTVALVATDIATPMLKTAEDRAKEKEAHLRIAAANKAAKEAKQAAYRAAHPKVKAVKVPKKEQKAAKGGKGKSSDKK